MPPNAPRDPRSTQRSRQEGGAPEDARGVYLRFSGRCRRRLERPERQTDRQGRPLWTERPLLVRRDGGAYDLIGTSANLRGLARWVVGFGRDADVRSPRRLRRLVAALALQALEHHRQRPAQSEARRRPTLPW
jgi:hypothetical protein